MEVHTVLPNSAFWTRGYIAVLGVDEPAAEAVAGLLIEKAPGREESQNLGSLGIL